MRLNVDGWIHEQCTLVAKEGGIGLSQPGAAGSKWEKFVVAAIPPLVSRCHGERLEQMEDRGDTPHWRAGPGAVDATTASIVSMPGA